MVTVNTEEDMKDIMIGVLMLLLWPLIAYAVSHGKNSDFSQPT